MTRDFSPHLCVLGENSNVFPNLTHAVLDTLNTQTFRLEKISKHRFVEFISQFYGNFL